MDEEIDLNDVLQEQQMLESLAREKFPYDPSACTLYMDIAPRQLLFTCLTCKPANAICYSCGLRCHADHQLVDLYTKRNYRCDCGTTRFGSTPTPCCLRVPTLNDFANTDLNYNHNFEGKFCLCEESFEDEGYGESAMFQCLLGTKCCEDWFHARCILKLSKLEEQQRQQRQDSDSDLSGDELDVVFPEIPNEFGGLVCPQCIKDAPLLNESEAVLKKINDFVFLKENYGEIISINPSLSNLLSRFPFLNGNEQSYLPKKDLDESTLLEAGERALQSLPHEQVIDGIHQFNSMQTKLIAYLKNIAQSGRPVTKEDINAFFGRN